MPVAISGIVLEIPVEVPGALLADGAAASLTDLCHSLWSLYLPPAALPSLPHASVRTGSE